MEKKIKGDRMILDRQASISDAELRSQLDAVVKGRKNLTGDLANADIEEIVDHMGDFIDLMQVYRGALHEISTKLEILDDEYHVRYEHNPIHHMERRVKSVQSIIGKLRKRNLPLTVESIEENIFDVAGIRVICNYVDDVYSVASMLSRQSDIEILAVKDYIAHPKPSGYRSLHVIYNVPVFLTTGSKITPVEVQFRTIAMDYWASLEHNLRYKGHLNLEQIAKHAGTLQDCAATLAQVESTMQSIHREIVDTPQNADEDIDLTDHSYTVIRDDD